MNFDSMYQAIFIAPKHQAGALLVQLRRNQHCDLFVLLLASFFFSDIDYKARSIVQEFVPDSILIEGHRFDVGIFVAVTSLDPLRAYTFDRFRIK